MKHNYFSIFTNGLSKENPLLVISIGLCSSLAVTTSIFNGIGMGFSMMFVLTMSEVMISAFRKHIPDSIRLPIFIIIIAAFTTIVQLLLEAYLPSLSAALGVFLPLIVVNCIIMGRVDSYSANQPPMNALCDALGMGLGYTWVLCLMSLIREFFGNGTFFGIHVLPEKYTIGIFTKAPGGFLVFGLIIAVSIAMNNAAKARAEKGPECCEGGKK